LLHRVTKLCAPGFKALAIAVLLGGGGHASAAEDDPRAIVGVWRGQLPKDPEGSIELTITPTRIAGRNPRTGKSLGEGPYELDPATNRLDATRMERSGRGKLYRGIYSLSGGTLKWCATSRQTRPAELAHKPGSDQYLMTLHRKR
jgi:uncharacterized protein (TIGR03067 family)